MIRTIENQAFYDKGLSSKIEAFNSEATTLDSERGQIESELATLRTAALTGDVDGLAGLGKKRDSLKSKLLNNLIQSVKLAESKSGFQVPIEEAYFVEHKKRDNELLARGQEVEEVFKRHNLSTRLLTGVKYETCHGLRVSVADAAQPPKIENDTDRAMIVELRNKIGSLMA